MKRASITPFDKEHVLSDCKVISNAARCHIDKVISTGPLLYISCDGIALLLDHKDRFAFILVDGTTQNIPDVEHINGRLCISWPQEYSLCNDILIVTDRLTKDEIIKIELYSEFIKLIKLYGA